MSKTKKLFRENRLLLLIVICLAAGIFLEKGLYSENPEKQLIDRFQQTFSKKEAKLREQLARVGEITSKPGFCDLYLNELAPFNQSLETDGTGFLIYRNGNLFYWSDRAIAFRDRLPLSVEPNSSVVLFPNGYYAVTSFQQDSLTIIGLILLKTSYAHENQYLKNSFRNDFKLPAPYRIIKKGTGKGYPVLDFRGEPLFSIVPEGDIYQQSSQVYFPGIFYLAMLILLLIYTRRMVSRINSGITVKLLVLAMILVTFYWLHLLFKIPGLFTRVDFFSPAHFAFSGWLPSLGDFLILSLFFFYFVLNLYYDLRINMLERNSGLSPSLILFLLFFFTGVCYFAADYFIRQLILNSSFSFTLNQINEITPQSVLGIGSVMLLLFGLVLLSVRMTTEAHKTITPAKSLLLLTTATLILLFIHYLFTREFALQPGLLYLIIATIALFYASRTSRKYGMSYLILITAIITLYSIEVIYKTTEKKERGIQKLMAGNLVAEHDPAAELFLVEIQEQINVDPHIPHYLIPPLEKLDEYLESTYFSGFFRQYDLQITICTGADSVVLHPQNTKAPCFPFFETMISNQGSVLPGTSFYYMDNMDGRITYFGKLHYPLSADSIGVSVFIDLKSKIQSEGIGFPELLIDKSMRKPSSYKKFDYAKYFGGELVDRHGSYPYNYYIYSYNFEDNDFSYNVWDGYEHLIHRSHEDNYVIVSRRLYSFIDYLISFPYLFVFYFLFSLLALRIVQPTFGKRKILFDLKFRIQAAIISIVFLSLLVVALSTILYNLEQSKIRLQEDLDQKMNSISVEMDLLLENEGSMSVDMREWLMPELVKLSNVFQTDINMYGVDGNLIVSSRPEIFNRGLVSRRINTQAYFELFENFQTNYFQPEKIGELSYLSAYEPIINNNGDYLGFINLPYFTHQDRYSQEISTFIVAFINLYVLLFLASIVVAVFIANQITLPLATVRENLRKIELGKRNEHIQYHHEDEIGKLVKEYNKKVDELAVSADLLARSERESAWREMAKQVAHEIKNPLTPMKLNIQHLQRFRGEGQEYQAYVNRIAQTLINQIDTLSDIATEFSNFAQIPTAMKQVFILTRQIGKVIELYENHDRVKISFDEGDCRNVMINADREQLSRALINLIKNGIQAIPEEREGKIRISLNRKAHNVIIAVADNGTGISQELQEKMFSPNFTTKSSGMGLGLAIVKNIAENFNGRVWYETVIHEGTTFFLEIPVYEDRSQTGEISAG